MDKNWLIRTKSNHILGPVSKEKVVELYHNGSIKPDDEVCSGNGYWFFIREDDLVARFLLGSEPQGFNPISEAKDVLTPHTHSRMSGSSVDDITLVNGINISQVQEEKSKRPPTPDKEHSSHSHSNHRESASSENKKKNNVKPLHKPITRTTVVIPVRKQDWLKYVSLLGFIILFLLIYFRKTIIFHLFQGEVTSIQFNLIDKAHAQEDVPSKKKSILESSITYEKITFRPSIGLEGFNVASSFQVEEISCSDLSNEIYQLGILLYPPEVLNENFLIKLRDCVVKLPEASPLKKWMKWVGESQVLSKKDLERQTFLTEIISSQFNLITDTKIKQKIVNMITEVPENTLVEKVLKSYLYLMIGNITRSDNILRSILSSPPRVVWEKSAAPKSIFHRIASTQIEQIFNKMSRHPADRKIFELFILYGKNFFNQQSIIEILDKFDTSAAESKVGLKFIESLAPSFVRYLRLTTVSVTRRVKMLQNTAQYPLNEQSYWVWAFLDIDPLITESLASELARIEKEDQLWFIYLMENERLADIYAKKSGKSFLPARRAYLKEQLNSIPDYMMALYKLIQIGDINHDLVLKTTHHILQ